MSCRPSAFDLEMRSEPARSRNDKVVVEVNDDEDDEEDEATLSS